MNEIINQSESYIRILSTLIAVIVVVELLIRLPIKKKINSLLSVSSKAFNILFNPSISDLWKEKVLPIYSLKIFKTSFLLTFNLLFLLTIFLTISSITTIYYSNNFDETIKLVTNLHIQLFSIICGAIYFSIRTFLSNG